MASTVTIYLNLLTITLSTPGLLANLVEKSEVDLDVSKYSKKWVAMFMIIFTAVIIVGVIANYQSKNFVFICPVMIASQIMLSL